MGFKNAVLILYQQTLSLLTEKNCIYSAQFKIISSTPPQPIQKATKNENKKLPKNRQ